MSQKNWNRTIYLQKMNSKHGVLMAEGIGFVFEIPITQTNNIYNRSL